MTKSPRVVLDKVIQGLFLPDETGRFWELVRLLNSKAKRNRH